MSKAHRKPKLPSLNKIAPGCGRNIWAYPKITDPDYLHRMGLLRTIREIAESLPQEGVVADIGCGWMPYKEWFSGNAITYVPLDVTGYPDRRFRLIRDGKLPLESSSVDFIICWQVLEHVIDLTSFFEELKRVMKPGCRAFFTTHGLFRIHDREDFWRWTPEGLRVLFEENGFTGLAIKPCDSTFSIAASLVNNVWTSNDSGRVRRFVQGLPSACINTLAVLAERLIDTVKITSHRTEATTYLIAATPDTRGALSQMVKNKDTDSRTSDATLSVCVAICTRNRAADLKRLLPLLEQLDYLRGSLEFVIVDNASTDDTSAVAKDWCSLHSNAHYVSEPRPGLVFARNAAWRHSSASLVAYIDDDAHPDRDWLTRLTDACRSQERSHPGLPLAIGGRVKLSLPESALQTAGWLPEGMLGWLSELDYGPDTFVIDKPLMNLVGANFAVPRNTLEKIGGFSETLPCYGYGDERWVERRILETGGRLVYVGSAVVNHQISPERITREWFRKRLFVEGRSVVQLNALRKSKGCVWPLKIILSSIRSIIIGLAGFVLEKAAPGPTHFAQSCRLWFGIGALRELAALTFRGKN